MVKVTDSKGDTSLVQADGKTPLVRSVGCGPQEVMALGGNRGFYNAADMNSPSLGSWLPPGASADLVRMAERKTVAARAADLVRNNGYAANAVANEVDSIIGATFRLSYNPDLVRLGVDPLSDDAIDFVAKVEGEWRAWSEDPLMRNDHLRAQSLAGQLGTAYRHYYIDGDGLGILRWSGEETDYWQTSLQVMDPDQLSNPDDLMDTDLLRAGVQTDQNGAAIGYHFRTRHEFDIGAFTQSDGHRWETLPRWKTWGRPQVVHFYDIEGSGQTRGISRLAPVVEAFAMEHKHRKAEIEAALLAAILGLYVESPMDHDMIDDALSSNPASLGAYQEGRMAYHDQAAVEFNGVTLPKLYPGEGIKAVSSPHPHSNFDAFETTVLRHIAAGLNTSYEELSADYSKTNYSSARAALMKVWRTSNKRRTEFSARFVVPIFCAWLEETLDKGIVELPGSWPDFDYARRLAAYTRCKFIGPARGYIDPLKEAKAVEVRLGLGLTSMEQEVGEQGGDWQEVSEQQAREAAKRKRLGLLPVGAPPVDDLEVQKLMEEDPDE